MILHIRKSTGGVSVIRLRNVLRNELSSLSGLCLRSKAHWGYDAEFLAACRTELTIEFHELLTTSLQVAERDATVVGLAQIKVMGANADLLKLFVEPAMLGAGIGRLLFEWATAKAHELGATRMMIEADPGAVPFYERMGALHVGSVPSQSIPDRSLPRLLMRIGSTANA